MAAGDWLNDYAENIKAECAPTWAKTSLTFLHRLEAAGNGLGQVTPDAADRFLNHVAANSSPATRNRALATCKRFYGWAIRTGRTKTDPFTGIRSLPEPRKDTIVYCTRQERGRIVASSIDLPHGLAIAVAFFTGCRREEIARMRWDDVSLDRGRIAVPKTKTLNPRVLPIAGELKAFFSKNQQGFLVDYSRETADVWIVEAENLIEAIRRKLSRPARCNPDGTPAGLRGKKAFAMTDGDLREPPPRLLPCPTRRRPAMDSGRADRLERLSPHLWLAPGPGRGQPGQNIGLDGEHPGHLPAALRRIRAEGREGWGD
jgi:integrase